MMDPGRGHHSEAGTRSLFCFVFLEGKKKQAYSELFFVK